MRRIVLSVVLAAGLAVSASAFASEPASPAGESAPAAKPAKPAKDDPNRMICTREHVVGSNRPEKICRTVAERDRAKDAAARALDETRRPGEQSPGAVGNP